MTWYPNLIKYRLFYSEQYREYVRMWKPTESYIGVPKRKRVSFDPLFVTQALENAMFDECFGKLSDQEQQFLIMLYAGEGSCDDPKPPKGMEFRILHSEEAFSNIMKTGLSPKEIWNIVNGALKQMVNELNKLEQIIV